ncbi:MAG TPA: cytochrome C oxidase subunit IV family protein [Terracidiphilus sp.]|nr:cytochrome C oxidase subunit IV family protein [Terracidiphilus sp.]
MDERNVKSTAHNERGMHIVSPKVYAAVGLSLLALTATTVAASYVEMYVFNVVVALGIAVIKMMLVVLFFMHVKYSPKLTKLTAAAGLFMFLVLVGMTLADYFTRAWGRW